MVKNCRYTAILNSDGECCLGIGEMEAFTEITQYLIKEHQTRLKEAPLIVLDGNPPLETMRSILEIAACSQIPGECLELFSLQLFCFFKKLQTTKETLRKLKRCN